MARERTSKYRNFIEASLEKIINSTSLLERELDVVISDLMVVIPKYGLNLTQLNNLIDIIIDPTNNKNYKLAQKNRLIKLLSCYEMIDYPTIFKIISCFKIPSSKLRISKTIQSKLAIFLCNNFVNIIWDRRYLNLLGILFNLISIGYLRQYIGVFLVYILQLSNSIIDSKFKLRNFYTSYKVSCLIEIFDKDKKVLPLVHNFTDYLRSNERKDKIFDMYYSELLILLDDTKNPKDLFGSIDSRLLEEMIHMKVANYSLIANKELEFSELANSYEPIKLFNKNVEDFYQLISYLNSKHSMESITKKRKLDDLVTDYTTESFLQPTNLPLCLNLEMYTMKLDSSYLPKNFNLLFFFFANYQDLEINVGNLTSNFLQANQVSTPLCYILPLIDLFLKMDLHILDQSIRKMLNISYSSSKSCFYFKLNITHHEILKCLLFFTKYSSFVPPTIIEILNGNIAVQYEGSDDEKMKLLCVLGFIEYLPTSKWEYVEPIIQKIDFLFNLAEEKYTESLLNLLKNWHDEVKETGNPYIWDCINHLLEIIISKFSDSIFKISVNYLPFIQLLQFIHTLPFANVKPTNLILSPKITYSLYFSNNPILIDALCGHITYCKQYYSEYGSNQLSGVDVESNYIFGISQDRLIKLKELHNSYVMDICNIIWRDKAFYKNEKSPVKGFMMFEEFLLKLNKDRQLNKSWNLFHQPAFRRLILGIIRDWEITNNVLGECRITEPITVELFAQKSLEVNWIKDMILISNFEAFKVLILKAVNDLGFNGLNNLLWSSLRSLSRTREKGKKPLE